MRKVRRMRTGCWNRRCAVHRACGSRGLRRGACAGWVHVVGVYAGGRCCVCSHGSRGGAACDLGSRDLDPKKDKTSTGFAPPASATVRNDKTKSETGVRPCHCSRDGEEAWPIEARTIVWSVAWRRRRGCNGHVANSLVSDGATSTSQSSCGSDFAEQLWERLAERLTETVCAV